MRGGYVVLIGIASIAISVVTGLAIFLFALNAGGARGLREHMGELAVFSAIANLLLYGGIIGVVVGIVLMVVQSQQAGRDGTSHNDRIKTDDARNIELEAENRRMREELAKLEKGGDRF